MPFFLLLQPLHPCFDGRVEGGGQSLRDEADPLLPPPHLDYGLPRRLNASQHPFLEVPVEGGVVLEVPDGLAEAPLGKELARPARVRGPFLSHPLLQLAN